ECSRGRPHEPPPPDRSDKRRGAGGPGGVQRPTRGGPGVVRRPRAAGAGRTEARPASPHTGRRQTGPQSGVWRPQVPGGTPNPRGQMPWRLCSVDDSDRAAVRARWSEASTLELLGGQLSAYIFVPVVVHGPHRLLDATTTDKRTEEGTCHHN